MLVDLDELDLLFDVWDGVVLLRDHVLEMPVFFIFFALGKHEGAELFKLGLEVWGVLVFLELGEVLGAFHIFVNKNYQ